MFSILSPVIMERALGFDGSLVLSSITGMAMMTRNTLLLSVSILWCMSLSIALLYAILLRLIRNSLLGWLSSGQ